MINNQKPKFGPAGNSISFYEQGYKRSNQMPGWLKNLGLDCYEYSCGRGANINEPAAKAIGEAAQEHNIAMSVHAPYFINLANPEASMREKSWQYIYDTLQVADWMGADRIVMHPGSCAKMDRAEAFGIALQEMKRVMERADQTPFRDITICPETMGKINQLGNLDEIIDLCRIDDRLLPTIDFGHLNAREQGFLKDKSAFAFVLDRIADGLGIERMKNIHVHFSHIEYTKAGEKKHLTFEDTIFGPDFIFLAELIADRDMTPRIICESKDVMAEDALIMKQQYISYLCEKKEEAHG